MTAHNGTDGTAGEQVRSEPRLTILCVDDELNLLKSLKRVLRAAKYNVLTTDNGYEGLELFHSHQIDIVISDMRMPKMDGAEFLSRVAEAYPETVRLLLTGYSDIASTIEAVNRGKITSYLHKPWNQEELVLTLAQCSEKIRLKRENIQLVEEIKSKNESLAALNNSLEEKVKQRTQQIGTALLKLQSANTLIKNNLNLTIRTFYNLICFNPYLGGESTLNISHLASLLAGLKLDNPKHIKEIQLAGLLCELGMMGLTNDVLETPKEELSHEQKSLYLASAENAHMALSPAAPLRNVSQIILHQHEYYSGVGVPDRLSADQIPLGSRIVAVARDYIYAISGKLFTTRMSSKGAIEYLTKYADQRYDPSIVALLPDAVVQIKQALLESNEKQLALSELTSGMKLSRDVLNSSNILLLPEGHVFSEESLERLRKFLKDETGPVEIFVLADEVTV